MIPKAKHWVCMQNWKMDKTLRHNTICPSCLWISHRLLRGSSSGREASETLTWASPEWNDILWEVNSGETFKHNTLRGVSTRCAQCASVLHGWLFTGCWHTSAAWTESIFILDLAPGAFVSALKFRRAWARSKRSLRVTYLCEDRLISNFLGCNCCEVN